MNNSTDTHTDRRHKYRHGTKEAIELLAKNSVHSQPIFQILSLS